MKFSSARGCVSDGTQSRVIWQAAVRAAVPNIFQSGFALANPAGLARAGGDRLQKRARRRERQMKKSLILRTLALFFLLLPAANLSAQSAPAQAGHAQAAAPPTVIFFDAGFPAADSSAPAQAELKALVPSARFATAVQLAEILADSATRLLILPYGSAYPEEEWQAIHDFLWRGGNLVVLGGAPFTRAAYHDQNGWHLREYSVRDSTPLLIDQYQTTPGSDGLKFETNPDVVERLPQFSWKRGFSPILHLTSSDVYNRDGSAGTVDARLDALAWGTRDGRKLAAPAIQIDHVRDRFAGGRWIFVDAELESGFFGSAAAKQLVPMLVAEALRGAEEFTVQPTEALYLPGEPVELAVSWESGATSLGDLTAQIRVTPEGANAEGEAQTVKVPARGPVTFPPPHGRGLYTIEGQLLDGSKTVATYRSGFWIRDTVYLQGGPRLGVNKDYFELDGKPLAVVGTTYMASDVQRLYFEHPNVYVWDKDLAQIHGDGLNMIRTGWWSDWEKLCDEEGRPYERTLRTMEALLMTARRNGLPVQFNFFAFLPDSLGGVNAYLDPQALRRQKTLISSVVERFHAVPFLAWDLVNEPSFSKFTWQMLPNGDGYELSAWNAWLNAKYADRAALADAWNSIALTKDQTLPVPTVEEFQQRAEYSGYSSAKIYDFFEFAQETFTGWVKQMREAVRATGSEQLITVGQDEGGFDDRLNPAFFGEQVDFTTNHSWWNIDNLLWDSLVAKQAGKAMLIQETGLQRELTLDEIARRTPEGDAALLERKIAMSFVEGSGAIQWLWNSNTYMTNPNEVPIGVLRSDETEKPEADVERGFAEFARDVQASLRDPQRAQVAIVTSQAAQFSEIREMQVNAQRAAVRAASYDDKTPAYVITENQIGNLGKPKLVILPSAQSLAEATWQALLAYAKSGGTLLITGPIGRDTHWHRVDRTSGLAPGAAIGPLTYHDAEIEWKGVKIPATFDSLAQAWLESLQFADGKSVEEISYGTGRIIWAAYPIEMAQGTGEAAELYAAAMKEAAVEPLFELANGAPNVSPGVLIYPTVLADSVLYVMESETDEDSAIDLRDKTTGAELKLKLPAQHAALALIRKSDGKITAKYGF